VSRGDIYLREGDNVIATVGKQIATEAVLQKLLADSPDLVTGDETGGDPRSWLVLSQEAEERPPPPSLGSPCEQVRPIAIRIG